MDPKDEIKEKLDVVEVIREYMQLKPAGSNWKGLCPFHQEKTPSFMVSQDRQSWHCFGCNIGGDVFSFVMKHENMDFGEVLRMFAERTGVQLRREDPTLRTQKTTTLDIMESAVKWWQMQLFDKSGESAREYMKKRGLNREIAEEWKLGYAPDSWEGLSDYLVGHGFKLADIIASGLVIERERKAGDKRLPFYDRFRNRIMFPIRDVRGRFVGATGRIMPVQNEALRQAQGKEEAKYINTPETPVYHKSSVLYGLDKAKDVLKETKTAVLVEGNMDVIASHRAGVTQAVATSGTALTPDHAKLLKRFADTVALSFDADEAGLRAVKRSIALLLRAGVQVSRIVLPDGVKDPDECVQRDPKEWQKAVESATPIFQFLFAEARAKDIRNVLVKKEVAKELLALIAVLPDPVEKGHYMKELSALLEVPENLLYEALPREKKSVLPVADNAPGEAGSGSAGDNAEKRNRSSQELLSEKLLSLLIQTPTFIVQTVRDVPPEAMAAGPLRDLYTDLQSLYSKNSVSEQDVQDFFSGRAELRDRLLLAAEHYFHGLDARAIDHERSQIIHTLMRASIKTELTRLEQQLAATTDTAAQQELLQRVGELNRRLASFL